MKSQQANTLSSQTLINSIDSTLPLSYWMGLKTVPQGKNPCPESLNLKEVKNRKYVTNSILEPVKTLTPSANIVISANPVEKLVMEAKTAQTKVNEIYGLQPKYLRHNLWEQGSSLSPTTAE